MARNSINIFLVYIAVKCINTCTNQRTRLLAVVCSWDQCSTPKSFRLRPVVNQGSPLRCVRYCVNKFRARNQIEKFSLVSLYTLLPFFINFTHTHVPFFCLSIHPNYSLFPCILPQNNLLFFYILDFSLNYAINYTNEKSMGKWRRYLEHD